MYVIIIHQDFACSRKCTIVSPNRCTMLCACRRFNHMYILRLYLYIFVRVITKVCMADWSKVLRLGHHSLWWCEIESHLCQFFELCLSDKTRYIFCTSLCKNLEYTLICLTSWRRVGLAAWLQQANSGKIDNSCILKSAYQSYLEISIRSAEREQKFSC